MSLPQFLKELRERAGLDIDALAARSKVHVTTLYKAEKGTSVKWESIRETYLPLTRTTRENTRLLLLWAANLDGGKTPMEFGDEEMMKVREDISEEVNEHALRLGRMMTFLDEKDREVLTTFCEMYISNESTRALARTWTEEVMKRRQHDGE